MKDEAIKHIISRCNLNEIVDILSDKLSGSELNSLLLEVFDRRITKETPSSLLSKYSKNKLAKPAQLDFLELKIAVWIFVLPNQIHIIIITTALELKLRLLLMG